MKIENGKLKTAENMTPARRYSFLVGKDEPCHTAIERFRLFLEKHNSYPTLDDLEAAFRDTNDKSLRFQAPQAIL